LNVLPSCKFTKSSKVWIYFSFSLIHFIMKFKIFACKLMWGGGGNQYSMWCFVCEKKYFDIHFVPCKWVVKNPDLNVVCSLWKGATLQARLLHLNIKWCSNQLDIKATSYH
jgi:hypothetical protein